MGRSLLACLILVAVASHGCAVDQADGLTLKACTVPGVRGKALCGRLPVPEDRTAEGGRTIELNVVVLKARAAVAEPDPIFFLHGGPGAAATEAAPIFAGSDLRQKRDIVLVDQRGTGKSSPLDCPVEDLRSLLHAIAYLDLLDNASCRQGLQADPRHYTTTDAIADLDAVREALGVERVNLIGGSYGTRVAFEYLRRHEDRVRAIMVFGVAPPPFVLAGKFDVDSKNALETVLEDCRESAACRGAFPDLHRELEAVLGRLEGEPGSARIRDPFTDRRVNVPVDRQLFVASLHYLLYTSSTAARLPAMIHAAHAGDFDDLVEAVVRLNKTILDQIAAGAFFAAACAEDAPFYEPEEVAREAQDTLLRGSLAVSLARACREWNVPAADAGIKQPVRSDRPVLLISGEHDPVTPPRAAARAAEHLPNAVHLVLPETGHSDWLPGCTGRIVEEFLDRGTMDGIDTSCVSSIRRPPFETSAR
jgi:pimeloyl-ACP methyl ester carboxylesterase